ncbi:MAG TPA: hypothetical protein VJR02_18430 [Pyrinomonadaceae bacterium]|nr:hypothetical protein [Pyrinomonadaceae bacterium]
MAVVINEFETVPRTERSAESDSGGGGGSEGASQPTEHEIEKMMELHASRCERLRAY